MLQYEVIRTIKKGPKSTVELVRKEGELFYVRKILAGRHEVYSVLQSCPHPFLPCIYEVSLTEDTTTIIEEYIEGRALGSAELSEKQLYGIIKELCTVLEFLHKRNIIYRDIKPSNIMLAQDGHIRLIDFDAARMPKEEVEQDTRLLGTRGYAPPEQYGFAQTDARTDIYALGVTVKQLLGERFHKPQYKRILQKCMNLNPDKRYQTVRQVRIAFSFGRYRKAWGLAAALLLIVMCCGMGMGYRQGPLQMLPMFQAKAETPIGEPVILQAPDNPHWDGETGIGIWGNVPECGNGDGEVSYHWRL